MSRQRHHLRRRRKSLSNHRSHGVSCWVCRQEPLLHCSSRYRGASGPKLLRPICNTLFTICARCDRGQRYCSEACRTRMRGLHQRAAARRYQASPKGREKHCHRQRAYRERQRPATVTHQGLVSISISPPRSRPSLSQCHVCGLQSRWINPFAGRGFRLPRHRRRALRV